MLRRVRFPRNSMYMLASRAHSKAILFGMKLATINFVLVLMGNFGIDGDVLYGKLFLLFRRLCVEQL